jgi:hypothetical protein
MVDDRRRWSLRPALPPILEDETNGDGQRIREKKSIPTESFGGPRTSRACKRHAKERTDETDPGALQNQAGAGTGRLIEQAFQELKAKAPDGVRYLCLKLDDGTFLHLSAVESTDGAHPITSLEAFRVFQSGIKARCMEPPQSGDVTIVGNYRMVGE